MARKAKISKDEYEALPEENREDYKESNGEYIFNIEPVDGWALENVMGLKTTLQRERDNAQTFKSKLDSFQDLDPKAARDALQKVEKMADWTPDEKVKEQITAIKEQLEGKYNEEKLNWEKKETNMMSQIEKLLIDAAAIEAITNHKGKVKLLLPHVRSQTKIEVDDKGDYVARVKAIDGSNRISMKTGNTGYMDVDELVESWKDLEDFAPAFAGSGITGSGATASEGTGSITGAVRISREDAKNPQKYRTAKARAEEKGVPLEMID